MNSKEKDLLDFLDEPQVKQPPAKKTRPAYIDTSPEAREKAKGKVALKDDDISKFLAHELSVVDLPHIELADSVAVKERTELYFKMCQKSDMRPTISGYATALGVTTNTLRCIKNDQSHLGTNEARIIKQAYQVLEQLWEDYMLSGKVNPVTGIFLAKNNYDYKDQQDVVVKALDKEHVESPEEIQKRYAQSKETIDLTEDDIQI